MSESADEQDGWQYMVDEIGGPRSGGRKRWPIIAVVVVTLVAAGAVGVYVYHVRQQSALVSCRQSLANFSEARKAVLDTSNNSSELQKLVRGALGVDDILDAFADAATSAEDTVDTQGCNASATITQLNLMAETLDSATDSLRASLKKIQEHNASSSDSSQDSGRASNSTSADTDTPKDSSGGSSDAESLKESKDELLRSIGKARKLVDRLNEDETLTLTGRKLLSALSKAIDSGQQLVDDSGIKDSKYVKAAKVTLDEAIDMADNWVNRQASKAQ